MAILRKRGNGYFYIYISRKEKHSLKTKDETKAIKIFELMQSELEIVDVYRNIIMRYDKILAEIREHHKNIANLLQLKKPTYEKPFITERGLEDFVYEHLSELGITPIGRQVKVKNGIVDILGEKNGKKIAIEVKLNSLSEQYLGQCLRYLKYANITEIYLIGERVDSSIKHTFKDFPIQIFTIKKHLHRSKNVFIKYRNNFRGLICDQMGAMVFIILKNSYKSNSKFYGFPSPEAAVLPLDDSPKNALNINVFWWLWRYLLQAQIYHKHSNSVKFNQFCDQNVTNDL